MPYLFDLDGTLIDSEAAHKAAEVVTFGKLGYTFTEEDLYRFTGIPYRAMLAEIAPALSLEDFLGLHRPTLTAKVGTEIRPFYDAEECLTNGELRELALVTSSPVWYVDAVFNSYPFVSGAFRARVCADDVKSGKPDPEAFLLAASRLGCDPGSCIAIEDSPNGIASAKAAGCYVVGIRRDDRLDLSEADTIIHSLGELSRVA